MLLACCVSALATHTTLEFAERLGLIRGDYTLHAHGSVVPVLLAAVVLGTTGLLLYVLHLFGSRPEALPILARESRARLDWRLAAIAAVAAAALLVGMESAEQLAAGHFDGWTSAFGSVSAIGLALIAVFSMMATFALRRCCAWIAAAHARIVVAFRALLRTVDVSASPALRSARAHRADGAYEAGASRIYGRRGPPFAR